MILLNDFARRWSDIRGDATAAFEAAGESGWYILGREVEQFENELAAWWGLSSVVGVASGLDAVELALRIAGCKAEDKVLTTAVSAFATAMAIVKIGAVPVFADVDEFGELDLDSAREALRNDSSIHFFLPVHLYGHALNLKKIKALQEDFDLIVIEDCAQSVGARWNGIPTGSVSTVAATSFYPTKNLGALGDGGAVLTNNATHAAAARLLRDYGRIDTYRHDVLGYNSRLDELQAAFLRRVGLPRLQNWNERRRHIAADYVSRLKNPAVRVPGPPAGSESCWHLFPVFVSPERKPDFLNYMKKSGIVTGEHYPIAMPDQRALDGVHFEIAPGGVENARLICRSEVTLPVHPYLTDNEVSTVIEKINEWMG